MRGESLKCSLPYRYTESKKITDFVQNDKCYPKQTIINRFIIASVLTSHTSRANCYRGYTTRKIMGAIRITWDYNYVAI